MGGKIQIFTNFLHGDISAVGRSENPGVPVLFGGHLDLPPLVEIGLTDLPKPGVAMAAPASPGTTTLVT